MEDEQIIELYLERNEDAIYETDLRYGMRLYMLAKSILDNHEDAQECRNDTYMKTWNSIPPASPRFFFAWLAKICRNLALDRLDWRNAKKRNMQLVALTEELEVCIASPDDEIRLTDQEISAAVSSFLWKLPKKKRQIFVCRYWHMHTNKAIALRFGMSETAVETELYRIRKKLREYLEKEGIQL